MYNDMTADEEQMDDELHELAHQGRPLDCTYFDVRLDADDAFIMKLDKQELLASLEVTGRFYRKLLVRLGDLTIREGVRKYIETDERMLLLDGNNPSQYAEIADCADAYDDCVDIALHGAQYYARVKAFDEQERVPLPTQGKMVCRKDVVNTTKPKPKPRPSPMRMVTFGNHNVLVIGSPRDTTSIVRGTELHRAMEAGLGFDEAEKVVAVLAELRSAGMDVSLETILSLMARNPFHHMDDAVRQFEQAMAVVAHKMVACPPRRECEHPIVVEAQLNELAEKLFRFNVNPRFPMRPAHSREHRDKPQPQAPEEPPITHYVVKCFEVERD